MVNALRGAAWRAKQLSANAARQPLRFVGLLVFLAVTAYLVLVPSSSWPSLLPSGDMSDRRSVPGWPTARRVPPLIAALDANLTIAWRGHPGMPPPAPLYAGPDLTPAQRERYAHLRTTPQPSKRKGAAPDKYMLVAAFKDVADQLPDMLRAIAVVTAFIGAERISVSIVEGPSADATPHVLRHVLVPLLHHLGVPDSAVRVLTDMPKIEWDQVSRIEALAKLRNHALEPLWNDSETGGSTRQLSTVGINVAAVVFFNDVYLHAADILELLHQHIVSSHGLGTGITTAWDWMERHPAYFYDVWVARTMGGELFYPIDNGRWTPSTDLFPTAPTARRAYDTLSPFQVYSAWNGMAILNPTPFTHRGVRFRRAADDECAASECSLLASDFWREKYGRVQVVPSVQLAYSRRTAHESALTLRKAMKRLGWAEGVPLARYDRPVLFSGSPPQRVRCHPWPETNGLDANVWQTTEWVPPF